MSGEKEYVSRELFDERSDRFMEFFKADKENIQALTTLINNQEKALTRILALEERAIKDMEHLENQIDTLTGIVTKLTALETERTNRVENHAGRIKELEEKPQKKWSSIATSVITGVFMALVGILIGYFSKGG